MSLPIHSPSEETMPFQPDEVPYRIRGFEDVLPSDTYDVGTPALTNSDYDRLLHALEPVNDELADSLVILVDLVAGATERRGFEPPAMDTWSAIVGALDTVRDNIPRAE